MVWLGCGLLKRRGRITDLAFTVLTRAIDLSNELAGEPPMASSALPSLLVLPGEPGNHALGLLAEEITNDFPRQ
jgi:hypothetical protein